MKISSEERIQKIFEIVQSFAKKVSYNTHHLDHVTRVFKISQELSAHEVADSSIVEASALLHDLGRFVEDEKDNHEMLSSQMAREILKQQNWPIKKIEKICHAIEVHRYSRKKVPESLEAKILQDADKIDALGAIGVIRVVSHNPEAPLYDLFEDFPSQDSQTNHTLNHFYNKILKLPQQLHTARGKQLAAPRIAFTLHFLENLKNELNHKFD